VTNPNPGDTTNLAVAVRARGLLVHVVLLQRRLGVAAQVEFKSKIEAKLRAVHNILGSSA